MTDLGVDSDYHVQLGEGGDIATVEGIREQEQQFALAVTDYFFEHIGDRNTSNVVKRLRLSARRAAQENDFITSLQNIEVESQEGDSLELRIEYNYDEEFEFVVT